jgi:hypothetical protein
MLQLIYSYFLTCLPPINKYLYLIPVLSIIYSTIIILYLLKLYIYIYIY